MSNAQVLVSPRKVPEVAAHRLVDAHEGDADWLDRFVDALDMRLFVQGLPYGPEDLADSNAPVLVSVRIPRAQRVADVHSPAGVRAVGLPATARSRATIVPVARFDDWFWA